MRSKLPMTLILFTLSFKLTACGPDLNATNKGDLGGVTTSNVAHSPGAVTGNGSGPTSQVLCGDANDDGKITTDDVVAIYQYFYNGKWLRPPFPAAGDDPLDDCLP